MIGVILRGLRIEAGLSAIQVADKLHISESTYRKYETDKSSPTLDMLSVIAKLYGKTLVEILPPQLVHTNNRILQDRFGKVETQIAYLNERMEELIKQNEALLRGKDRCG